MVSRYCKFHSPTVHFFYFYLFICLFILWTIARSSRLAEIKWSVCISKSPLIFQDRFYVLYIPLVCKVKLLAKFQENPHPTQSYSVTRWVAFVSVGVGASQRIPLSVLARNPHKDLSRKISHEIGRERGKEGPKDRRQESSQEKVSQEMRAGKRGDQSTEARKVTAKTSSLTWPTREEKSALLVALCEFRANTHPW